MRTRRVRVQRNVRYREIVAAEERVRRKMLFHDIEGLVAALMQARQLGMARMVGGKKQFDETCNREIWFVIVLLEEHPLEYVGAGQALTRPVGRALGQVIQDRIRLRQVHAGFDLQRGYAPDRIHGKEIGCARLALQYIDFAPLVGQSQVIQQHLYLDAVAGSGHAVDLVHGRCHLLRRRSFPHGAS